MNPSKSRKPIRTILADILIKVIIIAGICLLLYPTISNKWNEAHSTKIIETYTKAVESFTEKDYTDLLNAAKKYNEKLPEIPDRFKPTDEELDEYNSVLNVTNDGLMAYIEIPKLKVELPVYHGVSEAILQVAAGHIPGSSLPIGGPGTHSAISGHCGLTSATLFTHLKDLETGDLFYIRALNDILAYQVDRIDIVLPEEFDLLHIEDGHDYCTLITCTPYGVNSHRLLVRGERVPYEPEIKQEIKPVKPNDEISRMDDMFFYIGITAIAVIILIFVKNKISRIKERKQPNEPEEESNAHDETT